MTLLFVVRGPTVPQPRLSHYKGNVSHTVHWISMKGGVISTIPTIPSIYSIDSMTCK